MKCVCGNEIPDSAKFCGNCGRPAVEPADSFCMKCGKALRPSAKFCANCGNAVSGIPTPPSTCPSCGADLFPGARFCGKCRTPIATDIPASADDAALRDARKRASAKESGLASETKKSAKSAKEKAVPISSKTGEIVEGEIKDSARTRKMLLILLILGLCVTFSGICGKVSISTLSAKMNEGGLFRSMGFQYGTYSGSSGDAAEQMIVALLQNDSSGYARIMSQSMNNMGGYLGGIGDLGSVLLESTAAQSFPEMRRQLMNSLGFMAPMLAAMSYYKIMLIAGIAVTILSAVAWKLLKGKKDDIRELKLMPHVVLGVIWLIINGILTLMSMMLLQ